MTLPDNASLIEPLVQSAIRAGKIILDIRSAGVTAERKADHSPVTEADRAAEAEITATLNRIAPGVAVVAEEAVYDGRIPDTGRAFFLVDPLDGTREFVKGGSDFTVNIGLVREGIPAVGVIYVPAMHRLYAGAVGEGAWRADVADGIVGERKPMKVRPRPDGPIDIVASRSHRTRETDDFIAQYEVGRLVSAGSSVKFCLVACGEADLYPRMGTTMQWDTAAGDAILRAAGGRVVTLDGGPLAYGPTGAAGSEAFRNPWFVATAGIDLPPG